MKPLMMRRVRVRFERPVFRMETLGEVIREGLRRLQPLHAGARVAITAGSRGVANIEEITREIVRGVKGLGLEPFIVPAMGSHGGGTAEGQVQVLESFGITAERMGCPIRASMDVVEINSGGLGHPLYMDAQAAGAEGVLLVNRIKPHTDFQGKYESGLCKMGVIGLGKKKQAEVMHSFGVRGLRDLVPVAAERIFATGKIWGGVGIVENAYDETAEVEVIRAGEILEKEPAMLERARKNMPRLCVDDLDVLLVDELGKNISGTGMDTGIIGRIRIAGEPELARPRIRAIAVLDVTAESHGNGIGVGLADVTTDRLVRRLDLEVMRANVVTSGFLERGKVPVALLTDAEAYAVALRTCTGVKEGQERVMRIKNTLHVEEVFVSAAVERELQARGDVEMVGEYEEVFDEGGRVRGW